MRAERSDDAPAVRRVLLAAFGQPDEADLVDRLRADGDVAISLVADSDGSIEGHVLFSPVLAPFHALALAPVAVVPDRQGRGIGGALIREGLKRADAGGWRGVFVLGKPRFYRRFGFDAEAAAGFASPYAGPNLMVLPLGGPLPTRAGAVAHAPAFSTASA